MTPGASLTRRAIDFLCESGSYRAAEDNMVQLVLPLVQYVDADQIRKILRCVRSNNQLHYASAMPSLLVNLFQETRGLWSVCAPEWRDLCIYLESASPKDRDAYHTFPELRHLVQSTPA